MNHFANPIDMHALLKGTLNKSPGNYVTVYLRNGLGNRIFQVLAALGYAERYKKKVILCKAFSREGPKPHELGLFTILSKLFPAIPMTNIESYTVIQEKKEMNYSPLEASESSVCLYGYFQDERYFPSKALIPSIRTASYPGTYFIHIRACDYIGSFGLDLVEYHKKCFAALDGTTKYLVFSDDTKYADKYMKQFGITYTMSDKVDALESLVEMANCAGGICANSTFGWLGGLFQGDSRGKIFMPSVWLKGRDCRGIYPTWATVVSIEPPKAPCITNTFVGSLKTWQACIKEPLNLIVQASSICGGDLWMPFPIGMSWQYVKFFNNNPKWQIGPHNNTVLCAISTRTDSRRRPSGINRELIAHTLKKNGIHNVQLQGDSYFSLLPSYKFVISPEGNGIDCHRHYEALLAGCIPIMEYNEKIQEKYKGLPILYTRDYSELTVQYLEQKYSEMVNTTYDFSRLFLSYYSIEQQEEIKKCGNYWIKRTCGQGTEWYSSTPDIKWVTIINAGYVDFTKNFIESMKLNDCMFPLTVYCTDQESIDALKDYPVTCVDARPFLKFTMTDTLSIWQTIDYKRLVFAKLDSINYALKQFPNSYIGYIDMDIIMLKDPTKTIINTFKRNPTAIFVSQCDEPTPQCSNPDNCQHFCSGVIVFKNVDIVSKLVNYTPHDVIALSGDQHFLLNMANAYNVKHITIDKNIFLNGKYPGVNDDTLLHVPRQAELIHYNYLIGDKKVIFMKKNKMWYL